MQRNPIMNRLIGTAAAGLALAVLPSLTAPASATTPWWGPVVHQETVDFEDHFPVEDSCDVPGLTTQVDIVHHGTYVYRAFGRDRLPYVAEHWENAYTFTNVANGRYVTIDEDYWANDIYVRDQGDGTNVGLSAERVSSTMLDAEGRRLEYESIWTLARWTKDNGGTPQDPRDDEWIDWAVVREGGHVADYCSATVAAVSDPGTASRLRGHPSWRTLTPGIEHRQVGE